MFKRRLGRSNLEVSAMGLGCWAIGGPWDWLEADGSKSPTGLGQVDDAESIRAIHYALDAGINFFDTAANYGCGHSERILSQAIAGQRDKVILATKFGYVVDEEKRIIAETDEIVPGIRQECEDSLRRLQTDYIDLYQFHKADCDPEKAAEVRDVLEALVAEGKIRWYGWSTDNPEGARVFAQGTHCTAIQHWMNMIGDTAPQILAVCEEHDQASIIRSPLGLGILTGKFNKNTSFPEDDVLLKTMCGTAGTRGLEEHRRISSGLRRYERCSLTPETHEHRPRSPSLGYGLAVIAPFLFLASRPSPK
jgi:aryl-alcohol dehydrogenase-like predicted oxidoreductase